MSREAYVWGESEAADQVRALVVGLAPSEAGKRLMAVFQAYIDDSIGENGDFVLAGHVASADAWDSFVREWDELLQGGWGLHDDEGPYFHMKEMAETSERMERVPAFYRVIERHIPLSISFHFKKTDLESAGKRIKIPGLKYVWAEWATRTSLPSGTSCTCSIRPRKYGPTSFL